jgi:hypothetical protein
MSLTEAANKLAEFIYRVTGPKSPLREAIRVILGEINKLPK